MKKLIMTAAILGLTATGAAATDQNITLTATVNAFCKIGGSLTPSTVPQVIPVDGNGDVDTTQINVNIGTIMCNKASTATLSSLKGGLFDPAIASADSGFQHRINYTAGITDPVTASVTANASTITATSGTGVPTSGATVSNNVNVAITPAANGSPLMAGTGYTDTLTVSIVPN